jgi:hypothetical protein
MNWCRFCGRPCGSREFCDEVCYEEYEHDLAEYQASIAEELPGENRFPDDDPPFQNEWCGSGGCNF